MAEEKTQEPADTYHRHGEPDPSKWDESKAVTDRPNDTPLTGEQEAAVPNSTFAERAKRRRQPQKTAADAKAVDSAKAENKAVASSRPTRKTSG